MIGIVDAQVRMPDPQQLSTRPRAASSPQEFLWKQPLLVSVFIHAALLWIATTWWHTSPEEMDLRSQVVEVEVVERAVPTPVAPPAAKPEPVVPKPAVRHSVPAVQEQPIDAVVTPSKRQPPAQQRLQAASQVEHVQPMLAPRAEESPPQDENLAGHDDNAAGTAAEVSPSTSIARTIDIRKAYLKRLKELIERHKQYPPMARKGRQQGQVVIEFSIDRTGALGSEKVAKSSGFTLLDRAALKAVRAVDVFPELPATLQESSRFQIAISFILE
ncbi:MAG: energy transducer TonB [Desulfuromonadales bacterium]